MGNGRYEIGDEPSSAAASCWTSTGWVAGVVLHRSGVLALDLGERISPFAREVRLIRLFEPRAIRAEVDDSSPEQPVLGCSSVGRRRGRGPVVMTSHQIPSA